MEPRSGSNTEVHTRPNVNLKAQCARQINTSISVTELGLVQPRSTCSAKMYDRPNASERNVCVAKADVVSNNNSTCLGETGSVQGNPPTQTKITSFFSGARSHGPKSRDTRAAGPSQHSVSNSAVKATDSTSQLGGNVLKILSWNVAGLLKLLGELDFIEFLHNYDVIVLQETFLNYDLDTDLKFPSYTALQSRAIKLNTTGRASGGVLMLYRSKLEKDITVVNTDIENVLCVRINKNKLKLERDVLVIGAYVHPMGSTYYRETDSEHTLDRIEDFLITQVENDLDVNFLLAADMNSRLSDWSPEIFINEEHEEKSLHFMRDSDDIVINNFGKRLIEICACLDMIPLHGLREKSFPTDFTFRSERGNSVIDHFVCSYELVENCSKMEIISRSESDHLPIGICVGKTEIVNTSLPAPVKIVKYKWL